MFKAVCTVNDQSRAERLFHDKAAAVAWARSTSYDTTNPRELGIWRVFDAHGRDVARGYEDRRDMNDGLASVLTYGLNGVRR